MAYFLDLFSPVTYEAFTHSTQRISGFRPRQQSAATKIKVGDRLICYMTKLGRWCGVLEVVGDWHNDKTPLFYPENDPFTLRTQVKPIVWLSKEKSIPIRDDKVWDTLTFTRGNAKASHGWTGRLRASLGQLADSDGEFLEKLLLAQSTGGEIYPIDEREWDKFAIHKIHREDKLVTVTVPQDTDVDNENLPDTHPDVRESIKIQSLLAIIGAQMGLKIWLPRNNRTAVIAEWKSDNRPILDVLPLNYDETTIRTIEQIDVLWLRGRAIVRAFEVEHTTSIYSGILRMADLLALQPNMDIKLHIVAPYSRRDKVFQELQRPVFSLLDRGPLSESCTYISYDSVRELAQQKHLTHLSDSVLDEYAEEAE